MIRKTTKQNVKKLGTGIRMENSDCDISALRIVDFFFILIFI